MRYETEFSLLSKLKIKLFTNLKAVIPYSQLILINQDLQVLWLYFCPVCFSEIRNCNAQVYLWIISGEFPLSLLGDKTVGWDHFTTVMSEVC